MFSSAWKLQPGLMRHGNSLYMTLLQKSRNCITSCKTYKHKITDIQLVYYYYYENS